MFEVLKPIYMDLSNDDLLERCKGGFTQNTNESLNNKIWKYAPKKSFSGMNILKTAAFMAAATFNDGASAIMKIMERLNITAGQRAHDAFSSMDELRITQANRQSLSRTLEARRALRVAKTKEDEANKAAEGAIYSAGGF